MNDTARMLRALPIWSRMEETLGGGDSIILSAPHYFLGRELVNEVAKWFAETRNGVLCDIEQAMSSASGSFSYDRLWRAVAIQIGQKPGRSIATVSEFEELLRSTLRKKGCRLVLPLAIRKNCVAPMVDLLGSLHALIKAFASAEGPTLTVLISEDFSLSFYDRAVQELRSSWYRFRGDTLELLNRAEVGAAVQALAEGAVQSKHSIDWMHEITDGHPGLLLTLLRRLPSDWMTLQISELEAFGKKALAECEILARIRNDIAEDAQGLATTALEFAVPKYPPESLSPRFQLLRELGILGWNERSTARLTNGVIGDLIREAARARPEARVGTVLTSGGKRFEPATISPSDDDLVVLHISDLHVGDGHTFRFSWLGGSRNQGSRSLADTLYADVERMGIDKRIDAVIITGDIACSGTDAEYRRAFEILSDTLERLSVPLARLVIVPGNHDLNWTPGTYEACDAGKTSVTGEPFEAFAERLQSPIKHGACIKSIASRGGGRVLRVIGLDSNWVESKDAAGIGYVSIDTLQEASNLLSAQPKDPAVVATVWVALHHHVLPVTSASLEQAKSGHVSVMANAPLLLSYASQWNAELILHGHQHQPCISHARRWLADDREEIQPVLVVGAGSCGAIRDALGPIGKNHYYALVRRQADVLIRSRLMGDQGLEFTSHSDLEFPLKG